MNRLLIGEGHNREQDDDGDGQRKDGAERHGSCGRQHQQHLLSCVGS